eukprot:scaffold49287_cov67-Phaeocystis_antarctica.AAC.1
MSWSARRRQAVDDLSFDELALEISGDVVDTSDAAALTGAMEGRDSRLPTPVGQVVNPLALLTRQIFADHTLAATDLCTYPFIA